MAGPRPVGGRDVAQLMNDFGHDLPTLTHNPAPPVDDARLWRPASGRGRMRANAGWMPASAPVVRYQMTSDQAPVFWPFIHAPGLPPAGAAIGIDQQSGGVFHCDPLGWVLHESIPVTNPNTFIFGKPGGGKSGTAKAFINRMLDFGYRALIAGDPKDEYEPLCRAHGVEPFAIGPGLSSRINPLAFGPLGLGWANLPTDVQRKRASIVFGRWQTLVRGLVGSMRAGDRNLPYGPIEAEVVKVALEQLTGYDRGNTTLTETTIPALHRLLDQAPPDLIARCHYSDERHFYDHTRLLRDALGQLVSGPLAGLFDDHTSIDVDWSAPITSLSLSRLTQLGDEAVGIALLCLNSWARGMREGAARTDRRIILRDECWKQFRLGIEAVKSFDADLRLSRGVAGEGGDIQVAIAHKPSDLLTAGDQGTQAHAIAKDLLALADIKVLHGQDAHVARELDTLLELGETGRDIVTRWARQGRGRALWVVADSAFKVQTVLHPAELELFNTNTGIESAA